MTTRDLIVALAASGLTLAIVGVVRGGVAAAEPVMSSSIFEWSAMTVTPTKIGERRDVFRARTATLDELELHVTTLQPGQSPHAPHKHPAEELLIVKEGTVESLVNGTLQRVGPGSVIFQASNQEHAIRNVGTTPATYHVIQWHSPGMKSGS